MTVISIKDVCNEFNAQAFLRVIILACYQIMPWQQDYSPKQIARITQACNKTATLCEKNCVSVCPQLRHSNMIRNTKL